MKFPHWLHNSLLKTLHFWGTDSGPIRAILMYHSVGEKLDKSIPPDDFRRQMEYIKKFRVETLRKFPLSDPIEQNVFCVTFDDGTQDHYNVVRPILNELNIPGTFFVPSNLIGEQLTVESQQVTVMNEEQLCTLVNEEHEVGSHTRNHVLLTEENETIAREEVNKSKLELEQVLGKEIASFAYPKGDMNEEIRNLVSEAGYNRAVTTEEGLVLQHDSFQLPRVWIHKNLDLSSFRARCSGALESYITVKSFIRDIVPG